MHGLKHLTRRGKLVFDHTEPGHLDQVRHLLEAARERWVAWEFTTVLAEGEDVIEVVVRRSEHDCVPRALEEGLEHWFGVDVTRDGATLYIDRDSLKDY